MLEGHEGYLLNSFILRWCYVFATTEMKLNDNNFSSKESLSAK